MHQWLFFCLTTSLMPGSFGQTITPAHSSRMVTIPALVEEKSGQIALDLSATDFSIKDGGIEQQVQLEDNANPPPLSLLLVIQAGGKGAPQLGKIARLNDLLDSILTGPRDQVAILTFDSRLTVIQGFSTDSDAISHSLASIAPGNTGAALQVDVHRSKTNVVSARSGYWFSTADNSGSSGATR